MPFHIPRDLLPTDLPGTGSGSVVLDRQDMGVEQLSAAAQ